MTFKPNRRGIGELLKGPEAEAMLLAVMEERKGVAEAISPERTGHYKASFAVEPGVKPDRACAVLRNDADYAIDVEFGAKNTPRHRVLGRALGVAEGI